MNDIVTDPELEQTAVQQQAYHVYEAGLYLGVMVATEEQVAAANYTIGEKPPVDLVARKLTAFVEIKNRHATALRELSGDYSPEERDTWTMQLEWARKYKAGDGGGPMLEQLMTEKQRSDALLASLEPADVMADHIIAKSNAFELLVATANGLKRTSDEAVEAAATIEELETVIEQLKQNEATEIAAYVAAQTP